MSPEEKEPKMPIKYKPEDGETPKGVLMMQAAAKNKKIAAALTTYAISQIAVEIAKSGFSLREAFDHAYQLMTECDLKLREWQKEHGE